MPDSPERRQAIEAKLRRLLEEARGNLTSSAPTDSGKWMVAFPRYTAALWVAALPVLISEICRGNLRFTVKGQLRGPQLNDDEKSALANYPDQAYDLASDMYFAAIERFLRSTVGENSWDPNGGNKLLTHFVTACKQRSPAVIKQWRKDRRELVEDTTHRADKQLEDMIDRIDSAEKRTEELSVARALAAAPSIVRPILAAIADGFTAADAARSLGISAGAADNRLYRYRREIIQKLMAEGKLVAPTGSPLRADSYRDPDFYSLPLGGRRARRNASVSYGAQRPQRSEATPNGSLRSARSDTHRNTPSAHFDANYDGRVPVSLDNSWPPPDDLNGSDVLVF